MKELSIEEKARAYDEALEMAKKEMSKDGIKNDVIVCGVMKKVFPELTASEDEKTERISKEIIKYLEQTVPHHHHDEVLKSKEWIAWLEKQDTERTQLYVRFGDIPSNEKSKIYHGEDEIGDENGVSVYPAFELNGNIVLGLTLPITKTTLYTQQHLLEYDNRPCYLVSGDYVGKGTDGEPLIKNISVIKRLDNYRIKEYEKKSVIEMKTPEESLGIDSATYNKIVDECIYGENKPKFHEGEWIVQENIGVYKVIEVCESWYEVIDNQNNHYSIGFDKEYMCHLWSIKDAKEGDILTVDNKPFIYNGNKNEVTVGAYCGFNAKHKFSFAYNYVINQNITPSTKEQRDILFQKMKEVGHEWDEENKELKKIEQKSSAWSEVDEEFFNDTITFLKDAKMH